MNLIFSSQTQAGFIKDIDGKEKREVVKKYLFKEFKIAEILKLNQIHGNVVKIDESGVGDGIVLTKKSVAGTILTADCFPVAIRNKTQNISGIFHCGWRGVVSQILYNGVRLMKKSPKDDFVATIFPGIEECCFEIGEELKSTFLEKNIPVFKRNNKLFADLKTGIKNQLKDLQIKTIEDFSKCTFCNKEFFSFRRNKTSKRHLSFIIN